MSRHRPTVFDQLSFWVALAGALLIVWIITLL